MSSIRNLGLLDGVLFAIAALGIVAYWVLTPQIDPLSVPGVGSVDQVFVTQRAVGFAERHGAIVSPDSLPTFEQRVSYDAYRHLVAQHGRSKAVDLAQSDSGSVMTARVYWPREQSDDLLTMHVTHSGLVVSYDAPPSVRTAEAPPFEGADRLMGPDTTQAAALVTLAYHLNGTIYSPADLTVESVRRRGPATTVVLSDSVADGAVRTTTVSFAGDVLHRIVPEFSESLGANTRSVVISTRAGLSGLFLLLLAIVLVRRLSSRQVDAAEALRDAFWMWIAFTVWFGAQSIRLYIGSDATPLAFWFINLFIVGAVGAFAGYVVGATAESLGRPIWPLRYRPLALLRTSRYGDVRLGRSVLRGVLAGLGLSGFVSLLLALMPQDVHMLMFMPVWVAEAPEQALVSVGFVSVVAILATNGSAMAIGAWMKSRFSTAVAFVAVWIGIAVLLPTPMLSGLGWEIALLVIGSLLLTVVFFATDAVGLLLAFLVGMTLFMMRAFVLSGATPVTMWATIAGVALLLVYAGITLVRGQMEREAEAYVPPYVAELARDARIARELEIAQTVQKTLLPATMPTVAGAQLSGLCIPASEVGGDYYDAFEVGGGRIAFVIGDVSGKGFQAAFYMTLVKGFARAVAQDAATPADALRRMNTLFWANVPRGIFVTMIYAVYDPSTRRCTFARAGHNPALLRRADGKTQVLRPPGLGLGLQPAGGFDPRIVDEPLSLYPGDTLVLYTDGFSEAMTRDRIIYTDERLAEVLATTEPTSADRVRDALLADTTAFVDGAEQHDDMTLLVLSIT